MLDATLVNGGGTVAPHGALHLTGDYSQGANATLQLDLRGAGDGDALTVDGAVALAGTLRVTTGYAPAANAAPLALAATSKPSGSFAKTIAPISATRGWAPAYGANGVTLTIGAPSSAGGETPASLLPPSLHPSLPVVGGRTRCDPGSWRGAHSLGYRWFRGGRPIAKATTARYRVAPADGGHKLSCQVTARAVDGARTTATSRRARALLGLSVSGVSLAAGGVSAMLVCAPSERRCSGTLRVLVAGRAIAQGHFSLRAPGGVARLDHVQGADLAAGGAGAVVRVAYRNRAGAGRLVLRRLVLRRS